MPREAWPQMDAVNLEQEFHRRVNVIRKCPAFLRGRVRHAYRVALEERDAAAAHGDLEGEDRAWKVFGLIPQLILCRPAGCERVDPRELEARLDAFSEGRWRELLEQSRRCERSRPKSGESSRL